MTTAQQKPLSGSTATFVGRRVPHILSIDDDPEISHAIQLRLRDYEVCVRQAFFGMQGFWETIREAPDLILLDMVMPQGNGQFVLECLRNNQHSANIPVIMLSGTRDERLRALAFELGAAQFLQKPVVFEDLLREIRRFVDVRVRPPTSEPVAISDAQGDPSVIKAPLSDVAHDVAPRLKRYDRGSRGSP